MGPWTRIKTSETFLMQSTWDRKAIEDRPIHLHTFPAKISEKTKIDQYASLHIRLRVVGRRLRVEQIQMLRVTSPKNPKPPSNHNSSKQLLWVPETGSRWRKKRKKEMIKFAMSKNFKKYVRVTYLIDKRPLRHSTISIEPPTIRSNRHLGKTQVKLPRSNVKSR